MNQSTRNIVANSLLVVTVLLITAFVVQHFQTPPHPSWHKDLVWFGLASLTASEIVRGRRRRAMQNPD